MIDAGKFPALVQPQIASALLRSAQSAKAILVRQPALSPLFNRCIADRGEFGELLSQPQIETLQVRNPLFS